MGNLFSVKNACEAVGLDCQITSDKNQILSVNALILPGVGAFGDAMRALGKLDLIEPLRDLVSAGIPLMGICLGMQLVMSESEEFGSHQGLSLIPGPVVRFRPAGDPNACKVPQVGWNGIYAPPERAPVESAWQNTPLETLRQNSYFYFVHSYYARPERPNCILSMTRYAGIEFCSCLQSNNIFACQFHPERSGPLGLSIYRNFSSWVARHSQKEACHV
jgi:glutamine amidotransferase